MDTVTLIPGSDIKSNKFKIAGGIAAVGLGCALVATLNSGKPEATNPLSYQNRLVSQRVSKTVAQKLAGSQKERLVKSWDFKKAAAQRKSRRSEPWPVPPEPFTHEPYDYGSVDAFNRAEYSYEDHNDDEFFQFMDELQTTTAYLQTLDKDELVSTVIFSGLAAAMLKDDVDDLTQKLENSKDALMDCEAGYDTQNNDDEDVEAICLCDNGVPNRKVYCNKDRNLESCASCAPGYTREWSWDIHDYVCKWNACFCSNGEEAPQEKCLEDDTEVCASCYTGYEMGPNNDCSTCSRGYTKNFWGNCVRDESNRNVGYVGYRNTRGGRDDDDDDRRECPNGYHWDTFLFFGGYCAENQCYCDHGEATRGPACPWQGNHECKRDSCDWGYEYGWLFGECSPIEWD